MTIERPDDQPFGDPETNLVSAASLYEDLVAVLEVLTRVQRQMDNFHELWMAERRRYKALLVAHGIKDTTEPGRDD